MFSLIALAACLSSCGADEWAGSTPLAGEQAAPVSIAASPGIAEADRLVITSPATASVAQSQEGVFHKVVANDAEGSAITYSIVGGAHADHFVIEPNSGSLALAAITPTLESSELEVKIAATNRRGRRVVQRLTVALRRAATPSEIIYASGSAQPDTPSAPASEPAASAPDDRRVDTRVQRGIQYAFAEGDAGEEVLRFDLYTPLRTRRQLPVMILAHGGGFGAGTRADVQDLALDLVGRGFAVAAIDYRLMNTTPITADTLITAAMRATHDMYGAVRFLRANRRTFRIDANRIFVGGVSAGGVMASVAATFDPADTTGNDALARYLAENGGVYGTVGAYDSTSSEISGALSMAGGILELGTIGSGDTQIYMAHFELDFVVPCGIGLTPVSEGEGLLMAGSCAMQPQLDAVGVPNRLFLVTDRADHVTFTREETNTFLDEAAQFFGV